MNKRAQSRAITRGKNPLSRQKTRNRAPPLQADIPRTAAAHHPNSKRVQSCRPRKPRRVELESVAMQPPHRRTTNTSWQRLFPKHFHHPRHRDESSSPARPADACRASSRARPLKNAGLPLFDFRKQARLLDAKQPFRTLPICSGQLNSVLRASSTISGDEPWLLCPAAPSTN